MQRRMRISLGLVVALSLALMMSTAWAREQGKMGHSELPSAVAKSVKDNFPNADIDTATIEQESGMTVYNIEFKAGHGEIEIAEDGTVLEITTIVEMKDVPKAAAEAIQKAAAGATIKQLEKSEVRAEMKDKAGKGRIIKLASPRYVFEAELVKGNQAGEIEVSADGTVIKTLKWRGRPTEEEEDEPDDKEEERGK